MSQTASLTLTALSQFTSLSNVGAFLDSIYGELLKYFQNNIPNFTTSTAKGIISNIPVPIIGVNPAAVAFSLQDAYKSKKASYLYAPFILSYKFGGTLAKEAYVMNVANRKLHRLNCPYGRMVKLNNAKFTNEIKLENSSNRCKICFA